MRITKSIIPFLDVLFTYLMVFLSITFLITYKVNKESAESYKQNALYLVVLTWEGNADLDLWMKDPMGRIVGFKRREGGPGSLFSLNRDCLGASTTEVDDQGRVVNKVNEEIISMRGTFIGEYIVNVHSYNMKKSDSVKATVKLIQNKPYKEMKVVQKTFDSVGEEQTFFRFTIDDKSVITDYNDMPTSIISDKMDNNEEDREYPNSLSPVMPFR